MATTADKERERKIKPEDAPIGDGIVKKGVDDLRAMPAYKDYQMLKYSNGEKPVSFQEWKKGAR